MYGKQVIGFVTRYYQPMLYALLSLAALVGIAALVYFKYYRPKHRQEERQRGEPEELPIPGQGNHKLKEQQQGKSEPEADKSAGEKDANERKTA